MMACLIWSVQTVDITQVDVLPDNKSWSRRDHRGGKNGK